MSKGVQADRVKKNWWRNAEMEGDCHRYGQFVNIVRNEEPKILPIRKIIVIGHFVCQDTILIAPPAIKTQIVQVGDPVAHQFTFPEVRDE